jgi:hypothetical protein
MNAFEAAEKVMENCTPSLMSNQQAQDFLDELIDELKIRLEALQQEGDE